MLWRKHWWEARMGFWFGLGMIAWFCVLFARQGYDAATATQWAERVSRNQGLSENTTFTVHDKFSFTLPVTRRKVLFSQAAVSFGILATLTLIASLLIPTIARFHGQWFSLKDAAVYALLIVVGGAAFFCFAFLLSVIFRNWLWPVAIAVSLQAICFWFLARAEIHPMRTEASHWWGLFDVMTGKHYFYHGRIPWPGLLVSLTLAAMFLFTAVRIFERRDL
ncbi:MAG: hypothetical protein ACREEM_13915 [Blastocatellia bacterium]